MKLLQFCKHLLLFTCSGIEDGQTVRMPVGSKEIFITFRVSDALLYSCCHLNQICLVGWLSALVLPR